MLSGLSRINIDSGHITPMIIRPATNTTGRHPKVITRGAISNAMDPPRPLPTETMDIARPRFLRNHRFTAVTDALLYPDLNPTDMSPIKTRRKKV